MLGTRPSCPACARNQQPRVISRRRPLIGRCENGAYVLIDRARRDIHHQREQRGVEHESDDAVHGRGAADDLSVMPTSEVCAVMPITKESTKSQ